MPLELFLRGLAIGFAVAFALGPIGLLVIKRTVDRGWAYGFLSGIGVATADATYGAIAAFGLTAVTELLVGIDRWLGIVGGCVLLVLAAKALRDARRDDRPTARADPGRLGTPLGGWLVDGRADAHQPGHDPVVRGAVREHRRRHGRHRRRDRRRGGRVHGIGRLVGDPDRRSSRACARG